MRPKPWWRLMRGVMRMWMRRGTRAKTKRHSRIEMTTETMETATAVRGRESPMAKG